jgi:hypothetical protein
MASTPPTGKPQVDVDKIKDTLKKAGIPIDDQQRLDQISQEIARTQGTAEARALVCNRNYCLVVKEA